MGVCEAGDLVDEEGDPRNVVRSLKVNAIGVTASALIGTSPATAYIESSTGIREGGRTGADRRGGRAAISPFHVFVAASVPDSTVINGAHTGAGGGFHAEAVDICPVGTI